MKKLLFLLMLLPTMVSAQTKAYQPLGWYGNLPALHVDGKQLKDVNGNPVVLHGVMDTPSEWFNSYRWSGGCTDSGASNCINYFNKLYKFLTDHTGGAYCNVFRLHMDPCWTSNSNSASFREGFTVKDGKHYDPHGNEVSGEADIYNFSKTNFEKYLKSLYVPLALNALKKGMYVVVRPCGVCPGYIEVGDYYNDYLTYIWDTFSKNDSIRKYSGQISIELANEPVTLRAKGGTSSAKAKHDFFQPIVDQIRSNGYDGIIWVPGTGWQASYEDYATYPIEGVNIGYAVHNYTGWYGGSDENYDKASNKTTYVNTYINQFKKQVPVVETNPIIITEVDWSPAKPSAEGTGHQNEHGEWVDGNYGTWATGSTSKWGVGYKALLDKCGNISMTLSSSDCLIDYNKSVSTGHAYPAFKDKLLADGKDPWDGSGVACFEWYKDYYTKDYPHNPYKRQWTADQGYGYYINPIVNGDFPDPDVIRVGDTYYMVSTTFTVFPGATILKSKDLVNWEYCANPLTQINNTDYYNLMNGKNHYSQGQWAASMNYHDGKFYVYFISYGKDSDPGKNILLTTTNPEGQWDMKYMDEHYYDSGWLFDDGEKGDGYLYVACGIGDIWVNKLDAKTLKKISSTKVIAGRDGTEGSHMYHIGDFYYLYLTTGGYYRGQTIYRSSNPMGPYEEMPNLNGYADEKSGNAFSGQGIHQGALVETQTGEWWTIMFKDAGAIGRVPYLEPVKWQDGWPIIGIKGVDVSKGAKIYPSPNVGYHTSRTYLPTNDTFTDLQLGMQWGWNHNPDNDKWSLLENPGNIRLHTASVASDLTQARNSLTQRIMGYNPEGYPTGTTTTYTKKYLESYGTIKMDISHMTEGDVAGLAVFQDPYSQIGVKVVDGKRLLYYYRSGYDDSVSAVETYGDEVTNDTIYFRAVVNFYKNTCIFYYSVDNETYTKFGDTMTTRFTLKYFTGQRYFIYNYATKDTGGYVDVDWFSTEPEYSEELYFAPGVLKTLSFEDATAKSLTLNKTSYAMLPGNSLALNITCTMVSGLTSNVTSSCSYQMSDPSVVRIVNGKIEGLKAGSTHVTANYVDPAGNSISTEFDVNVSFFPIAVGAVDARLSGSGTFTMAASGAYGTFKPGAGGKSGWHYESGVDISNEGRYIIVKLNSASIAKPSFFLYDENNINGNNYTVAIGSSKEVVIDLEEAAKTIDLSHIYYAGFTVEKASGVNVISVEFSNDGVNPTAIEEIAPETCGVEVVSVSYYGADGRRQNGLKNGVNIVRRTYSDGTSETVKIIKK